MSGMVQGLLSQEEDPTLTFEGDGPFNIRLIAIRGRSGKYRDYYDKIVDPLEETRAKTPTINWTIQSCSPPYEVYLRGSGTSGHDQIWRFHDGTTTIQSTVNRTYAALGEYSVELGNFRCGDTAWTSTMVDISLATTSPEPSFEIVEAYELEEGVFLAGSSIQFENTSGLADYFVWVFPGGTSSDTDLELTLPEGLHEIELQAWCGSNVMVFRQEVLFAYPNGFHINEFRLKGVQPFAWDVLDPEPNSPDMYLGLFNGTSQIGPYTAVAYDFQQGSTVSWPVDFTCSNLSQVYTIKGYDDDEFIDQFVGEAGFHLGDVLLNNPGVLVNSFTAENDGFVVEVHGEWY